MRTLQYTGPRALAVVEEESRAPRRGEVQIAVAFAGLCGTDLHIFHGDMDARVAKPLVFGHEMSGIVSAVGGDAGHWSVGDRVTVMPLAWDGTCPACREGNEHICQNLDFIGIDSPGALQERWNVPASTLVALPRTLPLDAAALVEPVAVAVHDVRRSELVPGHRAVVIGGGPIGVLIASVARNEGADVVVIEVDERRRAQIAALGFATLDPRESDAAAWVEEWTHGAGADVVFEVSGAAAAVASATALAKVRGTIVIVAIHSAPREVDLQRVFWRELRILGARVYRREDFERAVGLLEDGAIPTEAIISRIVDLTDAHEAFTDLEGGRAMKVLVKVGDVG
jgi:2-desacetyl-2-hydroxyethyl bacteriochlorophyllide A dehydrogenase